MTITEQVDLCDLLLFKEALNATAFGAFQLNSSSAH